VTVIKESLKMHHNFKILISTTVLNIDDNMKSFLNTKSEDFWWIMLHWKLVN